MRTKSQAEILENKLKLTNFYRILMIVFLVIAVIGTTLAIIFGVQFKNYKNALEHPDWISIVIQTKQMPDSEPVQKDYQLNVGDYKGAKVDGTWLGQTLADFLTMWPNLFSIENGFIKGIKGSENDPNFISNYWWAVYSPTDPNSVENPDLMPDVGVGLMILQTANVYYFAIHKI